LIRPRITLFWDTGVHYIRRGLAVLRVSPWLYVAVLALFAAPAVLAAVIVIADLPAGFGRSAVIWGLNAVSASVAPPVIMILVAGGYRGHTPGFRESITTGLRWLPRYLWTNLHTTVIFWVPVSALLWLQGWQQSTFPVGDPADLALTVFWFTAIAALALYLHTRTLLAPFLAVHGNLPGTLAALESWRLSGRHFARVFGVFIISSAPVAVPLGIAILAGYLALGTSPERRDLLIALWPSLIWVFIKFIRPLLIAAVYGLYHDLWREETERRLAEGSPDLPRFIVPLLRLSAFLPRLLGRATGRRLDWTL
jgi:hypothetical protein